MRYLTLPFFPVLLGIYPALLLYANNKQHFPINVVLAPMTVSLLFVMLGYAVFYAVMKSAQKAAFMVGICCATVILYNPIYLWIEGTQIETPFFSIGPTKLILGSALLIFLLSFIVLNRTKSSLSNLIIIVNVFAVTIVLTPAIIIFDYHLLSNKISVSADRPQDQFSFDETVIGSDTLPDIYHIILDGYGRWDIYRDYFDFDNDTLRDFFDENGFLVSDVSRSNYSQTALSFAAMLNGNYLQEMFGNLDTGADTNARTPVYNLIKKNAVFSSLSKAGYRVQVFYSGVEATDFRGTPIKTLGLDNSRFTDFVFLDEFQSELLHMTPLPNVWNALSGSSSLKKDSMARGRINFAFDNIGKAWTLEDERGNASVPVYSFAHIAAPHHPHLYNADGTPFDATEGKTTVECRIIGEGGISAETYVERHVNYVKYLNQRLTEAIERILQSDRRKTVILVSSDHGPRSNCEAGNPLKPAYVRERMANLLAIYAPDMVNITQFSNATPVNYYRLLFNGYLGANLPLLPDHVYNSAFVKPFAFVDVTKLTASDK